MKLASFLIKNFKRIGEAGCEIRIDKIVVLVGQNNVGKSTVLDAYEAFAAASAPLSESFFHKEDISKPIEITGIFREVTPEDEEKIGKSRGYDDPEYGRCVKVRFVWTKPDVAAQKQSFSPEKNDFIDGGVGGIDALIQSRIPKPVRIKPTDATEITQAKIVSVLKDHVENRLKADSDSTKAVFEQINLLADNFRKRQSPCRLHRFVQHD
ncbi:AAA family ATPase [Pseudoduganella violaceinigra]|uniref:AAA family ATPase n=1 Tax=Pseudoduganella violaceinigra TaxID=246602 RepID=UPI00048A20A3|nr:AAA family ATPase [Pseudoduganella violaceinigra]